MNPALTGDDHASEACHTSLLFVRRECNCVVGLHLCSRMRPFVFDYTICFVFCQVFVTCFLKVFLCDVCHIVVGGLVGLVGVPCCPVGSCATAGFGVYGG